MRHVCGKVSCNSQQWTEAAPGVHAKLFDMLYAASVRQTNFYV